MNVDISHFYLIFDIIFNCIMLYIIYQISNTLRLMCGVLKFGASVSKQTHVGAFTNTGSKQSSKIPEPVYVKESLKIDDTVYVTKVSDHDLTQNPNKNIGNSVSVKNDIDDDINKLKHLKKDK